MIMLYIASILSIIMSIFESLLGNDPTTFVILSAIYLSSWIVGDELSKLIKAKGN